MFWINQIRLDLLALDQIVRDQEGVVLGPFLLQLLWQFNPGSLDGLQLEELVPVEADGQGAVGDVFTPSSNENDRVPEQTKICYVKGSLIFHMGNR